MLLLRTSLRTGSTSPANTTTLSPMSSSTSGGRDCCWRDGGGRDCGRRDDSCAAAADKCVELAFDESERNSAVLGGVTLMSICIVTVAAVRISGVAVRLDVAGVWAYEASGSRRELLKVNIFEKCRG